MNAENLFRSVAPEVAARFAFRVPPRMAAQREAEIARLMHGKPGPRPEPVGYVHPMARLNALEIRRRKMRKRREKVRTLHAEGKSATEIAQIVDAASWTILKDMKALGLKPHYPPFTKVDMKSRRRAGVEFCRANPSASLQEICKRFGVSDWTARSYRREAAE